MKQEKYYIPQKDISINIIGAGGIIHDAHLPAYQIAGYKVHGIYDMNKEKANALAQKFSIPNVYDSLEALIAKSNELTIYDIALPATEIIAVLQQLPAKAAVLIQKPMGNNYAEATQILQITQAKELIAAINFQLRYAPFINAARAIVEQEKLGEICDIEVYVNVHTPWDLWSFMKDMPRIEILYHSIHYVDLIRSFLGNPKSVYAKTLRHPHMKEIASVRTNIIMDYGDMLRANILTNHCHSFGYQNQESYIKIEGTKGAIKISLGVLIDYPRGVPDKFEYILLNDNGEASDWKELEIQGGWFPHAFIGSMAQVMMAMDGIIDKPNNSVEDAIQTMACVEAAYLSSEKGGVTLNEIIL
jgi:predicted dehydrogenase